MKPALPISSCGQSGSPALSRREWLERGALGFGSLALADLLASEGRLVAAETASATATAPPPAPVDAPPHFPARARSVIFLFMGGGPSQVDTFDPKPELTRLHGQDVPESIARNIPRIARSPLFNLMGSPWKFSPHGQSGIPVSELFPEVARHVDDLCILRGCRHNSPIHAPAEYIATTGTGVGDRPSLGAWLYYGLGSENRDLPGFVVFKSGETVRPPAIGNGFLPARFQGTIVDADRGVPNAKLPAGFTPASRAAQLEFLETLNRKHLERHAGNSELEARIQAYELSARLQLAAPGALDLADESAATRRLYGLDEKDTAEFGKYCLWTRRLVERGVRFIQLRHGGWDSHSAIQKAHAEQCRKTDRPIAALLQDLKQRGLLDQTLVVWGGEFGRTPAAQGGVKEPGRDHSPSGYTMWLAGGGVRGGQIIGATDPVGYATIERPVHPNDLHATLLHALGIDQRRLHYLHNNRRELVTVNGGKVIEEVFG